MLAATDLIEAVVKVLLLARAIILILRDPSYAARKVVGWQVGDDHGITRDTKRIIAISTLVKVSEKRRPPRRFNLEGLRQGNLVEKNAPILPGRGYPEYLDRNSGQFVRAQLEKYRFAKAVVRKPPVYIDGNLGEECLGQ